MSLPLPPDRPTRARLGVAGFLCAMSLILYLDRVCMAQAVPPLQREFGLSGTQMALVLMAFTLAYGLFEIPSGHWGDRAGARPVLTRIVVCWSVFTMLTAGCTGFVSLLVVRFLFGAGEAGAYPNAARVITRWFPATERGRMQGAMLAAGLVGGGLSPLLAAEVIEHFGWRAAFLVFGSVGLVWAVLFYLWFRDDPALHPAVNEAERAAICPPVVRVDVGPRAAGDLPPPETPTHGGSAPVPAVSLTAPPEPDAGHGAIPWGAVARNRCILLLGTIIICSAFVSYLYISWYPKYLQEGRGVGQVESGRLASAVLAGGAVGLLAGGWLADRLKRAHDVVRARRKACLVCYTIAGGCLVAATQVESVYASVALTALSLGATYVQQPTWWSSATEVSGRHIGALFGLMNGMGVIGAMASQFFFGWFTDWRGGLGYEGRERWEPAYFVCVGMLAAAGACWMFVDPRRGVEADEGRR